MVLTMMMMSKNTITFGASRMSLLRTSIGVPETITTITVTTMTTAIMPIDPITVYIIVWVDVI